MNFQRDVQPDPSGASAPKDSGLGGTNPAQIGLGTSIGSIDVSQSQGSLTPTGKNTDMAVEGNGFFILGDGQAKFYSRDGSFTLDSEGNLVAAGSGLKVLGWMADGSGAVHSTAPVTPSSSLQLPLGQLSIAKQTSMMTLGGNLDASMAAGGSKSVTAEIYDSLGASHTLSIEFTKTADDGEWALGSQLSGRSRWSSRGRRDNQLRLRWKVRHCDRLDVTYSGMLPTVRPIPWMPVWTSARSLSSPDIPRSVRHTRTVCRSVCSTASRSARTASYRVCSRTA